MCSLLHTAKTRTTFSCIILFWPRVDEAIANITNTTRKKKKNRQTQSRPLLFSEPFEANRQRHNLTSHNMKNVYPLLNIVCYYVLARSTPPRRPPFSARFPFFGHFIYSHQRVNHVQIYVKKKMTISLLCV